MDLDSQSIEKRDFPISRRGYDPAAVDAHLRVLASEVKELQRQLAGPSPDSMAVSAGTQVQSIVAAAETAATQIESEAQASASSTREQAASDAAKTRADAVAQAQAQVAAVGRATATLLAKVESMDSQVSELAERLKTGTGGLAGDLEAVETNMGELYDAAAGRRTEASSEQNGATRLVGRATEGGASTGSTAPAPPEHSVPSPVPAAPPPSVPSVPAQAAPPPAAPGSSAQEQEGGEYDARLVALNMALNGDSREDTDRYIAENYEVADREKLLDEVFAAIEG